MPRRLIAILFLLFVISACAAADIAIGLSPGQLELRLRNEARNLLAGPFDFESVRFSFRKGLIIGGLKIGAPDDIIFEAKSITVKIDLWKQEIEKVLIEDPKAFIKVSSSGNTNCDNLLLAQDQGPSGEPLKWPLIELKRGTINADIEFSEDDRTSLTFENIHGTVHPSPKKGSIAASIELHNQSLGKLFIEGLFSRNLETGNVKISTRNIDIASIFPILPKQGKEILKDLALEGKFDLGTMLAFKNGKLDFEASIETYDCTLEYIEFPAPVENLKGIITINTKGIKLEDFKGETFDNPISMNGIIKFDNPYPSIELGIVAENLNVCEELIAALPEEERSSVEDFAPRGKADIRAYIVKPPDTFIPEITVKVDTHGDASISYTDFPYRLENLTGTLLVTPQRIFLKEITSVTGTQRVTGNGYVVPTNDIPEVKITVKGSRIAIDEKLREALLEEEKEIWDIFRPAGRANLITEIYSEPGDKEVSVDVKVHLDGFASARPVPFPAEIAGIKGSIHIVPNGGIRLAGIRGQASGGDLRVMDTELPRDNSKRASINTVFKDVSIGRDIIDALSSAMEEDLQDITAGGKTAGKLHIYRPEGLEDYKLSGTVVFTDSWLVHKAFPLKAENLQGTVYIKPDGYYLQNLTGKVADGHLEAWGELLDSKDEPRSLRLRMEGFNILADTSIRNSLPEKFVSHWDDFNPYGRADVAVWLDGQLPLTKVKKTLKMYLHDVSGKYVDFPYPVSGVSGEIKVDIDSGDIKLKHLKSGDGKIQLSGSVSTQEQHDITDLQIEGNKVTLDNALRDAMPEEIKTFWEDIELEGKASGTVKLHVYQPVESESAIYYDIILRPEDASLNAGFPFKDINGKVTLKGHVSPEGKHTLTRGLIQASNFTVYGLPVTWISLPVKLSEESVTLEPISGRMANGTLSGSIKVLFDDDYTYAGEFELKDASVKLGAQEVFGEEMDKTTGIANAWIRFQGKETDDMSLKGKGEIRLSKSNLWQVPMMSAVVNALSLGALPDVDFSESFGHFRIDGDRLKFNKVYFHSPVMNLDGDGTLFLNGNIDFIFKVSLISKIIPIPIFKDILSKIEGEINAIQATGTAKKVTVTLAPKEALKKIKWLKNPEEKEK